MAYIKGSHIKGQFDVQVDGNHRWDEDKVCEIDVYAVSLNGDGFHETDTNESLVHVEVPTGDYADDMWYGMPSEEWAQVSELPQNIRTAVENSVAEALAQHLKVERTQKYNVGDTVFITEYMFPGEVERHTVNGGYIIHMANSGERDEFAEDELEDYKPELWH